ncbi:TetR/AcrR family transcriptional regulator [Cohnella sp. 56]|uniref:TetR/AcrR family transcriptional regulator n=1 Tax=Cohnella sp. 56 TaxID=3113722 RepID=UPI0030E76A4A
MTEKLDRRKARTRQLLHDALMSLLQEKNAETITVTDVADRADVNRGTFYLHYKDVADMLQQMKDYVFERVQARVEHLDISEAMKYIDRKEPYPASVGIFEEIGRHAEFLRIMLGPRGDLAFARQLRELMSSRMYAKLQIVAPPHWSMPADYLVAFVASANFGLVTHWLDTGMHLTPEEMAKIIVRLMNYGPLVSSGIRQAPGLLGE